MELSPGSVIAGRYRVDKRIGAGGMGEVWAGEHLAIGVNVAVKTLLPAAAVSLEVQARFRREAFLLGRIRSDYVARVLDFMSDDEHGLVIVMELVEGDSLAKTLTYKRLAVEETVDLGADVASALADLHRAHVVHRDLKPGNIILQPMPGGRRRAVVVDFGVSRMMSAGDDGEETITGITKANMAVGTVEYMAPEQILNSREVTGSSDCYALGAILYRALTGRHVFGDLHDNELAHTKLTQEAPPLALKRGDRLAKGLESTIAKALKRRPSERYATAEAMLADLTTLRDLSRAQEAELGDSNTTTMDIRPAEQEAMTPPPPRSPHEARASSQPHARGQTHAVEPSEGLTLPFEPSDQRRPEPSEPSPSVQSIPGPFAAGPGQRGVPRGTALAGVALALAVGVACGALLVRRPAATDGELVAARASVPSVTALATADPAREPAVGSSAARPAAAAPTEIDLGELDSAPTRTPARPLTLGGAPPSTNKPAGNAKVGSTGSAREGSPPKVDRVEF